MKIVPKRKYFYFSIIQDISHQAIADCTLSCIRIHVVCAVNHTSTVQIETLFSMIQAFI